MWSCDTDTVAHVTSTGLVTSVAKGKAVVIASDKKNAAHFDTTEVCLERGEERERGWERESIDQIIFHPPGLCCSTIGYAISSLTSGGCNRNHSLSPPSSARHCGYSQREAVAGAIQ